MAKANDRARVGLGLAAVSAVARLASQVAPGATARWAAQRFLTTARRRARPAEERVLARADRSTVTHAGRALPVYTWGEGEVVLLAHGWNGSAAQMTPFVEPLTARGFCVVAYDAPAHGLAPGRLTHVPDMASALAEVARAVGARHVIAHSAGASAAALAARAGCSFDRVVMIAPPPRFGVWAQRFAEALRLPESVMTSYVQHLEAIGGRPLSDLSLRLNAAALRGPTLALFDRDDRLVPIDDAREALAGVPGMRVHETSGLGHSRIVADPAVVRGVARFVEGADPWPFEPRVSGSFEAHDAAFGAWVDGASSA